MSRLRSYHLVDTQILDLTAFPVSNAAWVQVVASSPEPCSSAEIYNGSNALLQIATGAAGQEKALKYTILPGRSVELPLECSKGQRISVKASTAISANTDYLVLNLTG